MSAIRLFRPEMPAFSPDHYGELAASLVGPEAGFDFGPPEGIDPADLAADVEAAAEMPCDCCGWAGGGAYAAFHRGREYRAYAICPACGTPTEI